jgi:hypothetical protein
MVENPGTALSLADRSKTRRGSNIRNPKRDYRR